MNEKNRALPRTSHSGHLALCTCVCVCTRTQLLPMYLKGFTDKANLVFQLRSELFQETKTEDEDNSSRAVLKSEQVFEMTRFALLYMRMCACVWVLCHAIILVENVEDMVSSGNHGDSVTFRETWRRVQQHYQKLISPRFPYVNPQQRQVWVCLDSHVVAFLNDRSHSHKW